MMTNNKEQTKKRTTGSYLFPLTLSEYIDINLFVEVTHLDDLDDYVHKSVEIFKRQLETFCRNFHPVELVKDKPESVVLDVSYVAGGSDSLYLQSIEHSKGYHYYDETEDNRVDEEEFIELTKDLHGVEVG
jgi:hypothetical protein